MRWNRKPVDSLTIDGLTFAVRWSNRRRTVGITVTREGSLRVAAPTKLPERVLVTAVRDKLPWVRRKLTQFTAQGPPPPPRRFDEGERLPYLGRRYRLTLVDVEHPPVRLMRGRLELARCLDGEAREALQQWYVERGQSYLERRVRCHAGLVGASPAHVVVRDLGTRRWGTCHFHTRTVTFHRDLMTLPPALVDYVVVHELAHLLEPNHGAGFWRHVERVVPDWRARRRALSAVPRHELS